MAARRVACLLRGGGNIWDLEEGNPDRHIPTAELAREVYRRTEVVLRHENCLGKCTDVSLRSAGKRLEGDFAENTTYMGRRDWRLRIVVGQALILAVGLLAGWVCVAGTAAKLAPRHDEWLNGPVSLLLTKAERDLFGKLTTDAERDQFIERFWEIRNPKAGSETNEFKDEFFARLAYANAFYGHDAGTDGWRTDRGRAYILFGKPQTSMNFLASQELYPTEMWFYSNPWPVGIAPVLLCAVLRGGWSKRVPAVQPGDGWAGQVDARQRPHEGSKRTATCGGSTRNWRRRR